MRFKIKFGKNKKEFDPNTLKQRELLSDQLGILLEIRIEGDKLQQYLKQILTPNFTSTLFSSETCFVDLSELNRSYRLSFFDKKIEEYNELNNTIQTHQDQTIKNKAFEQATKLVNGIKELFELIFFAANFQLQSRSILKKIDNFKNEQDEEVRKNNINQAIITDPKDSLLILYTPDLLQDISNKSLQTLLKESIQLPQGIDSQVLDIFQRLICGKACMELLIRREAQLQNPNSISAEDLDLRTINPRDWIATLEKNPSCIEEVYALNMHLLNTLENKITERLKPEAKTPWKLGFLGSRSKINHENTEYSVPSTIREIYSSIQETKKSINEDQTATDNNARVTKLLNHVNELLHEKTHTKDPTWGVFLNFLKSLIGIGRSQESQQTYSDFREITQLKR